MIHFEIPRNQSSIIKVIGVGGGGSNAVNYMHSLGIDGVDFVVCNTDSQALALSPVANKIQLGPHLTQGLGAGANPEIGKQASEESLEDITKILKVNTRMAFITAGMGGGTGTGGAPVVAKICKDLNILTVGIVTMPFKYEGNRRMKQADEGIRRMREHVDTILIISNDKLRQQFGNLAFTQAFSKADDVLATAAKCITDVITTTGQINVDFADVQTVMRNGGVAILGSALASGENRALQAVEEALNSPLLNDNEIRGARWILLNITSSAGEFEHTMGEAEDIQAYVQQQAGEDCDVILGMGHDPKLNDKIGVTIIATGFNYKEITVERPAKAQDPKILVQLGDKNPAIDMQRPAQDMSFQIKPQNNLNPYLVETPARKSLLSDIRTTDQPAADNRQPSYFSDTTPVELPKPAIVEDSAPVDNSADTDKAIGMSLTIKDEAPTDNITFKITEKVFTDHELEEKRRFEEEKRAFDERAQRLRNMSFNLRNADGADEMDAVPAYVRKNKKIEDKAPSKDDYFSGYSVGPTNDPVNGIIQTTNTFLKGTRLD